MKTITLTITVSDENYAMIDRLATQADYPIESYLESIIMDELCEDMEDEEDDNE